MSSSVGPEEDRGEKRPVVLPKYRDHGGYLVAGGFPVEGFGSALRYEARDDDLFVVTYPKVRASTTEGREVRHRDIMVVEVDEESFDSSTMPCHHETTRREFSPCSRRHPFVFPSSAASIFHIKYAYRPMDAFPSFFC